MMFGALTERAGALAQRAAERTRRRLANAARDAAPPGVRVDEVAGGVRLSGRGLGQRMLREPALRWLIERVR
jgi:hypothetical protein